VTAYFEGGIINFVFGEMWLRPGLDQRARRWLTLVGVGNSSSSIPIGSHVWSAMASGDATREEMFEFVLQYAIHSGWPRASVMQTAVIEQAKRVEAGLPYEA
jgi:4-carboxymuconolactone decarboxylase